MFESLKDKISKIRKKITDAGRETSREIPAKTVTRRAKAFVRGEVILDEKKLEDILSDFKTILLESDVAFDVAEKIIGDLKKNLCGKKFKKGEVDRAVLMSMKKSLEDILLPSPSLVDLVKKKRAKPYVIAFVGVNGTGKTTTIAKIVHLLKKHNLSCVIAASDTFRAGAIEQLEKHASKLGVRLIKHEKGGDSAAVAFDAIEHAKASGKDVVLIDTAGRMETNVNLMDEMKKIVRVAKPDLVLFIGDALTGNAAVDQAERFNDAVQIDGIILTKSDADAKGGSAISTAYTIKKPIFFLGTGQGYEDLLAFDSKWFVNEILA